MSMIVTIIHHGIPMMDIRLMLIIHTKFSVKWWDSLKIDPVISQLNKGFPPLVPRAIVQKSRSQSSLDSVQVAENLAKN